MKVINSQRHQWSKPDHPLWVMKTPKNLWSNFSPTSTFWATALKTLKVTTETTTGKKIKLRNLKTTLAGSTHAWKIWSANSEKLVTISNSSRIPKSQVICNHLRWSGKSLSDPTQIAWPVATPKSWLKHKTSSRSLPTTRQRWQASLMLCVKQDYSWKMRAPLAYKSSQNKLGLKHPWETLKKSTPKEDGTYRPSKRRHIKHSDLSMND